MKTNEVKSCLDILDGYTLPDKRANDQVAALALHIRETEDARDEARSLLVKHMGKCKDAEKAICMLIRSYAPTLNLQYMLDLGRASRAGIVPRIRIRETLHADPPSKRTLEPGVYRVNISLTGAVSALVDGESNFGLKPGEFEFVWDEEQTDGK